MTSDDAAIDMAAIDEVTTDDLTTDAAAGDLQSPGAVPDSTDHAAASSAPAAPRVAPPSLLFQAPDPVAPPKRTRRRVGSSSAPAVEPDRPTTADQEDGAPRDTGTGADTHDRAGTDATQPDHELETTQAGTPDTGDKDTNKDTADKDTADKDTDKDSGDADTDKDSGDEQGGNRRRRRRGGRRRRRGGGSDGDAEGANSEEDGDDAESDSPASGESDGDESSGGRQGGRSGQRGGQKGGGRNAKTSAAKEQGQAEDQSDDKSDGKSDNKSDGKAGSKAGGRRGSGPDEGDDADSQDESTGTRRRRRRRRTGEEGDTASDEPNTVVRVRKPRTAEDEITSLHGSTRLEAKKQRRREGREAGRRRAPIVSEAEFLARREAVERVMVIRQREDLTQIAVLEDKVLVEHYVARESQTSLIGNVYLGRVQNVLPSMEAAFIDIGKGRNAVLYAGEVNWDSLGAGNGPRKIEQVLKSGQPILVQVSKDPIGHKGARLTSQISLPGRFLVYVPDGTTSGISRKLPDTERSRLKALLKEIVPGSAGVIVRTAAEGASEEELTLDVERLTARWADIESKIAKGNAPQLLYGEPDLTLKVVRDLFTEDFAKLVISGDEAWDLVDGYVKEVAPDLEERLERYTGDEDVFAAFRVDEQIAKGLDRKVWLPSGGSLVIDRTEAMTVVDVNTGKFTGSGGNLEETVTKNNLEAAEEMVRQLRLRDIGGIIVVDFIDMVLESNRDLVLRRLVECLGRDRTRHQVAEVTSLGLVQMTRKRIGTGLVESFSETCEHCQGRGVVIHHEPVEPRRTPDDEPRRGRRGRGRGGDGDEASGGGSRGNGRTPAPVVKAAPSPKDIAAIAKHDPRPVTAEDGAQLPSVDVPLGAVPDALVPTESPDDRKDDRQDDRQRVSEPAPPAPDDDSAPAPVPVAPSEPAATSDAAADHSSGDSSGDAGAGLEAAPTPPVPAGPRLVTSTRRRVARRPAGPPAGGTAVVITADPDGTHSDGTHPDCPASDPQPGSDGAVDDEQGTLVEAGRAEQAHVPVKKRGRH